MRNLFEFIKTTVIGGFFGLVPRNRYHPHHLSVARCHQRCNDADCKQSPGGKFGRSGTRTNPLFCNPSRLLLHGRRPAPDSDRSANKPLDERTRARPNPWIQCLARVVRELRGRRRYDSLFSRRGRSPRLGRLFHRLHRGRTKGRGIHGLGADRAHSEPRNPLLRASRARPTPRRSTGHGAQLYYAMGSRLEPADRQRIPSASLSSEVSLP